VTAGQPYGASVGGNVSREALVIWCFRPSLGVRQPEQWYAQDVVLFAEGRWAVNLVEEGSVLARWSWDLLRLALPTAPTDGGMWMLEEYGGSWVRPSPAQIAQLSMRGHL
jgi:hypothetical protein